MKTLPLAVVVLAAALACAGPAGAGNSAGFADAAGDGGLAADVTTVSVSNADADAVTFAVAIGNRAVLDASDEVAIALDADDDGSTGELGGWDHVILVGVSGPELLVSTGEGFVRARPQPAIEYAWAGGFTLTVARASLAHTAGFHFFVRSLSSANNAFDDAPDGESVWSYSPRLAFGLYALPPEAPFDLLAPTPRAGSLFIAALRVRRNDTGAILHTGSVGCSARLGGKRMRPSVPPRFFPLVLAGISDRTAATCSWQIPDSARGQVLVASISVTFRGKTVARSYREKVR